MMITATELKLNLGKYLALASQQDIFITRNGKSIAKLTSAAVDKVALLDSLVGVLPPEAAQTDPRAERLARQ